MNTHFFFSAVRRLIVPAALSGATVLGTLGFSTVASAQERGSARGGVAHGEMGGRAVPGARFGVRPGVRFEGRPGFNPYWNAGYYGGYGVPVGPVWGGYGYRGWRGGEYRGGGHATFHGGERGGSFHGGGHGGGRR